MILFHWMDCHGTDITCPEFKSEVVGSYTDALRRQLTEALLIPEQGTWNGKCEFGVNEIYTLQCIPTGREQEDILKADLERRQCDRNKLLNSIDVMSHVSKHNTTYENNCRYNNKRQRDKLETKGNKRFKMDSSTPTINRGYRNTVLIPDDESPIVSNYRSNIQGIYSDNDGGETITDRSSARLARSPTRLSG